MTLFFFVLIGLSTLLIFFVRRDFLPFDLERRYDEKGSAGEGGKIPRTSLYLLIALSVLMMLGIEAEASHYDWLSQYFAAEFTLDGQPLTPFGLIWRWSFSPQGC